MPEDNNADRYIYRVSSAATADFTAVMAKAYRVFEPFDSSFAGSCLAAAELGASYLQNHPDIVPAGGFRNPADTQSGEYGDGYDRDERLWAYSELYLSTANEQYFDDYSILLSQQTPFSSEMSWQDVAQMGNISFIFSENGDEDLKTTLGNALILYSESLVADIHNDGFNVSIVPGEYVWGSNAVVLNRAIILILAYELSGNEEYLKAAQYQFNYVLGTNAHNISFVTGIGVRAPMHIHHRPSAADNISNPVPGYIAGGPNEYLQDNVLSSNYSSTTPPSLCYIDNTGSYASNEVCLNWNAPLVFTAGYLNGINYTVGIKDLKENVIPFQFKLYQNYPNPFNPSTRIKYSIPGRNKNPLFVRLKIYDVLGNLVAVLVNEERQEGTYEIVFNAENLSSGIYFYRLAAGEFSSSKKMAVIK
jgi:endoglucanase